MSHEDIINLFNKELDEFYKNQVKKVVTDLGTIWIAPHDLIKEKNPQYYNDKFQEFLKRNNINMKE